MVHTHRHPPSIRGDVIAPVGDRVAALGSIKSYRLTLTGSLFWLPFPSGVLKSSTSSFFLGSREMIGLIRHFPLSLVHKTTELGLAVEMRAQLAGLDVCLQTVTKRVQHVGDRAVADVVTLCGRERLRAAGCLFDSTDGDSGSPA